jgi:crotonobetainyl-CoA:carnitine CoA-transferase CaiB-like acyl-CoA transferase
MAPIKPLTGTRVVTTALNVPGPMAVERLHALGATVVKVEPPAGDPLRRANPAWYAQLAAGAAIETLDLKTASGRSRLDGLLADADLLLTAQRPAALARLGLSWDELRARYPSLCQVAIVGFPGAANEPGHDLTYLAAHGLVPPGSLPRTLFADVASSELAVSAALAVLLERGRTGRGQYLEVPIAEAAARLAAPRRAGLTLTGALLGGGFPGYNVYRARDGWIAVAALEPHFYERLCRQLGVLDPTYEAFSERFARESAEHWERFGREYDLPIGIVRDENSSDETRT